ncbi:type II secretion system F family protein [Candidatus Peregrinibacteria bacterium]|nr:type II secretion system F family protein [Candidatus Peregrinibacteria bacterium]
MPNMPDKNFATTGEEAFKLGTHNVAGKTPLVLNIQEEKEQAIILEKEVEELAEGGFLSRIIKKINYYFLSHSTISIKEKATFFHLLSVMVNSGIPMIKALRSLMVQMQNAPRLQLIIQDLSTAIERGSSLSESMLVYPNIFTEAEIGMVQSGEASGQIDSVLESISLDAEKAYDIRSKVKSAMIYPAVIFSLLIMVVIGMMVFVIPKLKELFENVPGGLPKITRMVIATSNFMVGNWKFLALGFIGLVIFFVLFKKTDFGRYAFDKFKLKIPIFGSLIKKSYLARFARSLSNLIDSNVSILRTLEITANSIGNEVYRKKLLLAAEDVKQGIPLAENLTASDLFPPMMVNMIDVGEQTAQLDKITMKVANFYESEVDMAVSGISKIIEPVILVMIGVTVGTVMAAIMLPIMKLSNIAGVL